MELAGKLNDKEVNIISSVVGILLTFLLVYVFFNFFKFGLLIFLFLLFNFLFLMSGKLSFNNIIFFLLFCSILCPYIQFESIPSIRPELILIFTAWILFIFGKFSKRENIQLKWTSIHKWFFIFGGCILFSILWSWVVKNLTPIGRDFFEIGKLIEYFLIFTLVTNLDIKKEDFKKYYIILISLFLISAIFGLIQYFDLFHNFNVAFIKYLNPAHFDDWLRNNRIVGTIGNPNDFGILMALSSFFVLVGILWSKEIDTKLLLFISFLIFVLSIILSFSRSALICFLAGIFFILFYKYPKRFKLKGKIRILFIILPLFIILALIFLSIAPPTFFLRIKAGMDLGPEGSIWPRLIKWEAAIDAWKQSPLFGLGPEKGTITSTLDNEWLLLLKRYGIVGFLIFFVWFFKFYRGIGKIQWLNKDNLFLEIFSISLQVSLIAIGIFMIPAGFYHSLQTMPILMTLLGIVYSQNNLKKLTFCK